MPAPRLPTPHPPSPAATLRDDLLAGFIVAVLLLPQGLAYALLAGLPPEAGISASLLPLLAYAVLGSSPLNAIGPAAVLALMTGQALAGVHPAQAGPVEAALVLSAETGLLLAAAALLKLDALASLLSVPVLQGFTTGSALAIAVSQAPALLGSPARGLDVPALLVSWWDSGQAGNALTAAFGLASLGLLWLARRWLPALAGRYLSPSRARLLARAAPLGLIVAAILLAWLLSAERPRGGGGGGPAAHAPGHGRARRAAGGGWGRGAAAGAIALVSFVGSLAVTERLGLQRGMPVRPRQELAGLAAANLAAGLSGGMPVGGSQSRTAVNAEAGARTRWAGVWAALFMALAMAVLARPLGLLPKAVLAATIIVAVLGTVEWQAFAAAWRYARAEAGVMAMVAALVVLRDAQWALALGVGASIALLLQRTAQPHAVLVGRMPGTEHYRNVQRYAAELTPGVLGLRIDESLLFINARQLPGVVVSHLDRFPGTARVLLQMSPVNRIDFSGLEALRSLQDVLAGRDVRLDLSEVKGPVLDRLRAGGWSAWFKGRLFLSHHQGVLGQQDMTAD